MAVGCRARRCIFALQRLHNGNQTQRVPLFQRETGAYFNEGRARRFMGGNRSASNHPGVSAAGRAAARKSRFVFPPPAPATPLKRCSRKALK